MKKLLTALISAAVLAMPVALVTSPASAATTAQTKDGQTSINLNPAVTLPL